MARLKLFQVAVLLHPKEDTKDSAGTALDSELIYGPETLLGKDERSIMIKVARKLDEKYLSDMDLVEFVIRNF